jgi:hypothetical protein
LFDEPQWESATKTVGISWNDLRNWTDESNWAYFDYKNIVQVIENIHLEAFEWSKLGFPERKGELGNLWIGTKGSYTPCHFDTYGCNLVSQVHGRKTWLLFPPEDTKYLRPTRIPYEESSVYSQINFSLPSTADLEDLMKCSPVKITLEPGDVLFVPPKYWHFVQAEDFSISVNTWVELSQDRKSRMEEALIRFLVGSIVSMATPDRPVDILNPNEEDLTEATEDQLEDMLEKISDDFFNHTMCKNSSPQNLSDIDGNDNQFASKNKKPKLSTALDDFLTLYPESGGERLERFYFLTSPTTSGRKQPVKKEMKNKYLSHFINAVGHPAILKQISEKFLESISREKSMFRVEKNAEVVNSLPDAMKNICEYGQFEFDPTTGEERNP